MTTCSGLATFCRSFNRRHFVGNCQRFGTRLDPIVATRYKRRHTGWGCSVTPRWFVAHVGRVDGVLPTETRRGSGHGWTMVLGCCRHSRFKNQVHLRELFRRWKNDRFSRLVHRHVKTNVQIVGDAWHDGGVWVRWGYQRNNKNNSGYI